MTSEQRLFLVKGLNQIQRQNKIDLINLMSETMNLSRTPSLFEQQNQPIKETEQTKREFNFKLFFSYIKEFEGLELKVYKDTTKNLTIGYGHKLTKKEIKNKMFQITEDEAMKLLYKDTEKAIKLAKSIYPNYLEHKLNVRIFMTLQAFNMGNNLRSFVKSNPHLINFNYKKAYKGFKKSLWCEQVKNNRCAKTLNLLKDI